MRVIFLALMLGACASIVPSGVAKLSQIDPLTADPEAIIVALTLPDGLNVTRTVPMLQVQMRRADTGAVSQGSYALRADTVPPDADENLPPRPRAGRLLLFRIAPDDVARLRAQQRIMRAWEAGAPEATSGSLSVEITGCVDGEVPPRDARVSVYLDTGQGAGFFPLVRRAPLSAILRRADSAGLGACK